MRGLLVCACVLALLGGCSVNSIDINEAKKIAQSAIDAKNQGEGRAVNPDIIEEKDYGWVFREVDKRYVDHPSMGYWILGVGPVVVDRSGYVYFVPFIVSWSGGVDEYVRNKISERNKLK